MVFQGPSEAMALCTVFRTSHLIAFIAVAMATAEHFEAITDFFCSSRGGRGMILWH